MAYGARTLYPKFSNNHKMLHLGTREIQLVLLKNALLLGVNFHYGAELVALQAPPIGGTSGWSSWLLPSASKSTHQTSNGVLDFKPNKQGEYSTGLGQGKCNLVQTSELDSNFAMTSDVEKPEAVTALPFDALLLAEGEWSATSKSLGISKAIDRFAQAIGLVINLEFDPAEAKTKDSVLRSFTVKPFDPVGKAITEAGLKFEFAEYLKGETHYIVVTIKKASLLEHGAHRPTPAHTAPHRPIPPHPK